MLLIVIKNEARKYYSNYNRIYNPTWIQNVSGKTNEILVKLKLKSEHSYWKPVWYMKIFRTIKKIIGGFKWDI